MEKVTSSLGLQLPNTGILVARLEFLWHLHTACTIYPVKMTHTHTYIYIEREHMHTCIYMCIHTCVYMHTHTCRSCLLTKFCPTLYDPMGCSPPGFSVHGIFPGKNPGMPGCHFLLQYTNIQLKQFITGLICELFFKYTYNSQLNFWGDSLIAS